VRLGLSEEHGRTPSESRRRFGERQATAQPLLKTGDIVGVTTSIDGLDCAHAGLCYRDASGVLRLLHGSTTQKAVILDAELATYLGRVSTHTGIMVARPLEVA